MRSSSWKNLVLIPLVAIALAGCGSDQDDYVATGGSAVPIQAAAEQEFGMVYLGRPSPGAKVDLLLPESDQVFRTMHANGSGVFMIETGTSLPAEFRLRAVSSDGDTLERYVEPGDRPYMFIDAVSTISSRYKANHPELTLDEIETKIRRGLDIRDGGLHGTNDSVSSTFSPSLFRQQAEQAGGTIAYAEALVQRIESGEVISFRGDQAPQDRAFFRRSPAVMAQFGEAAASIGAWLLKDLGSKIDDEVSYRLTGKINGAAGTSFGSAGSFEEVSAEIGEVESTITSFDSKIAGTYLADSSARIETKLADDINQINTATDALQALANNAASAFSGQPDTADHGPSLPPSGLQTAVDGLAFLTSSAALQDFEKAYTSTSSTENVFFAANLAASANGTASSNNGGSGGSFNNTNPGAAYASYTLRHDIVTQTLQDNFTLNNSYLTKLANLVSENANSSYLPTTLSGATGFVAPSTKLNSAIEQVAQMYGEWVHKSEYFIPEPVGTDLVLIDMNSNLMWYLSTSLGEYDEAQNGMIGLQVNGWSLPSSVSPPAKVGSSVSDDLRDFSRSPTMSGWRLPELSELETLRSRVIAAGGGTASDANVRAGLQNLGFFGLSALDANTNYKKFWYNGSVKSALLDETEFDYYDFTAGKTDSGLNATPANREDPSYTYVYCRTIGLSSDSYFGDTTQQLFKSYGLGPSGYTFNFIDNDPTTQLATWDAQVSAYYTGLPTTPNNQVQDWLLVTLSLPGGAATDSNGNTASDLAYVTYVDNSSGPTGYIAPNGRGGSSRPRVIFKKPGSVVANFTFYSPNGPNVVHSLTYNGGTVTPRLVSVGLSPKNVAFTVDPSSGSEQFYLTGYLDNGYTVDLTRNANVSYSRTLPSTGAAPWVVANDNNKGLMTFPGGAAFASLNEVTATYTSPGSSGSPVFSDGGQTLSDTAQFSFPATPPVITALNPTVGSTAGGTVVVLTGSGFTNASSVTVGGVAASFTVNTDSELTLTTPARAAGTATIVVTTPAGTSSANFTYN